MSSKERWLVATVLSCLGCPFRQPSEDREVIECMHPSTLHMEICSAYSYDGEESFSEPDFPVWCKLPNHIPKVLKEALTCGGK